MMLEGKSAVIMGAGLGGRPRLGAAFRGRRGQGRRRRRRSRTGRRRRCGWSRRPAAPPSPIACDVSQEADVEATIALAVSSFGRLDIIYNNVGVPTPRPGLIFEEHTVDDFDRLFAINAKGVFLGSKHAILQFKKQGDGGVILNTGSVAGLVSWGGSVYGSTKGAVHQLTKAVAIEGAPFDIRCNAICPAGMPYTNFTNAMGVEVSADQREQMAQGVGAMHPLGRPITAEDCAEAAVYLVSDHAKNVTGALLPVDGGYVAR